MEGGGGLGRGGGAEETILCKQVKFNKIKTGSQSNNKEKRGKKLKKFEKEKRKKEKKCLLQTR